MKNQIVSFLFVIILVAGTSCESLTGESSDGTTVVEGQVVDKYTGKGIADATVGVYSTTGMGGFNHKELEKQADGSGRFSFSFDSEDGRDYALIASKNSSYATNYADPLILKEDGSNKKLKVKLQPYSWVRVMLVNTPPKDPVARLHLQGFEDMINGQVSVSLTDYNRDTTFVRKVIGNTETIFLYEITDITGNKIRSNPVIFFPALDTTDLNLTY